MEQFIIEGGRTLGGEINISGAKNAALPIFFSAILASEDVILHNVPDLSDIAVSCAIFAEMGSEVETDFANNRITLKPQNIKKYEVAYSLASKMRSSIWAIGPLVAKYGYGRVSLPGGCTIGARPVDMHIDALKKLGADINFAEGYLVAQAPNGLTGAHIFFDKISVGATVTAVAAATLAKGQTIIENAACEPEVMDVCYFLQALGAKISGIGTRTITIEGVEKLGGCEYSVIPDRIEACTYLIAAAISRGKITCHNVNPLHMEASLEKLKEAGAKIYLEGDSVTLDMEGRRPKSVNITTAPYPGVATDVQAQFTLLNCLAEGNSIITETIFENRFMHAPELNRMGANIIQKGNSIYITGVEKLNGAQVKATDLRASVSLVLAGCLAQGTTIVDEIYHIDRGYSHLENQMESIGAKIRRQKVAHETD